MNKVRRLTWKYFWEQKLQEIMKGMIFIDIGLIGLTIAAYLMIFIFEIPRTELSLDVFFMVGILGIITFCLTGFVVTVILKGIKDWIESNWDEAKRRAENE